MAPDEQAHLLDVDRPAIQDAAHPGDDQVLPLVGLGLGPLRDVDRVLHGQPMDVEDRGQPAEHRLVPQPLHVDPHDPVRQDERRQLGRAACRPLP